MTSTPAGYPIDQHPDLTDPGPTIPLAWVMSALAEVDQFAAEYRARKTDLRTTIRKVEIHADAMREASDFITEYVAMRLDPVGWEAEQDRRCAEWSKGMGFTSEEDQ
jgi:hypothetical protein